MADDNPFYVGMTRDEVRAIMGPPRAIREARLDDVEVWRYLRPRRRRLQLRRDWSEFRFRRGALLPGTFGRTEAGGEVTARYGRRVLGAALIYAVITIGLALGQAVDERRLAPAREALRPGLGIGEVEHLFGKPKQREFRGTDETWYVLVRRIEPILPFVDLYLVGGVPAYRPTTRTTHFAIEFRNGEILRWTELEL